MATRRVAALKAAGAHRSGDGEGSGHVIHLCTRRMSPVAAAHGAGRAYWVPTRCGLASRTGRRRSWACASVSSDRQPTRQPSGGRSGGLAQQLSSSLAVCCCCCSLWLASPFAALADEDFGDPPAAPFTVYGTVTKRYVIERLQEGTTKVVGRDKGVTVTACSSVVETGASDTPEWMGVRTGPDGQLCATQSLPGKVEKTSDLKRVCGPPCVRSCRAAVDAYSTRQSVTTGYALSATDKDKVFKSCSRSCAYGASSVPHCIENADPTHSLAECTKPGKAFDYAIPYRP